jgi:3',5'-cyclic AMP phosphodiesterase CpdA
MSEWVAILSDVHIGEERPHAIRHPRATELLLQDAVDRLAQIGAVRAVLLGDTVNQGWTTEYQTAKDILAPLDGNIEPVVGNHELQRADVADFVRTWGVEPVREITVWGMPALILNSGIEGLPDTQWNGRLDDAQLARLEAFLTNHRGQSVTIFCHHPIAGTVRVSDAPMHGLDNSDEVLKRLRGHDSDVLFFSGHTHAQSVVRKDNLVCIGCPALCFWPHAILIGERMGDELRLSTVHVREDEYTPDTRAMGVDQLTYRANNEGTADDWRCIIKLK